MRISEVKDQALSTNNKYSIVIWDYAVFKSYEKVILLKFDVSDIISIDIQRISTNLILLQSTDLSILRCIIYPSQCK